MRRPTRGRAVRLLGALTLSLALILLLLLAFLQTEAGAELVRVSLVRYVNRTVLADGQLEIEKLSGNFLSRVAASGVTVRQGGRPAIRIGRVETTYRLLPLLTRRVRVRTLELDQVQVDLWQRPDSTWNVAGLLQESPPEAQKPSPWIVQLDAVASRRIQVAVRPSGASLDSLVEGYVPIVRASGIDLRDAGASLRMDTLEGSVTYPSRDRPLSFGLAGRLSPDALMLDTLFVQSADSDVRAGGVLPLRLAAIDTVRFDVRLARLGFHDLRPFVPALDSLGSVHGLLSLGGQADSLVMRADLAATDGMSLVLASSWTPLPDSVHHFAAEGRVQGLDPAYLTGNPRLRADLNAELSADFVLQRSSELSGKGGVLLSESRWQGQPIERVDLRAEAASGLASLTLEAQAFGSTVSAAATGYPFDLNLPYSLRAEIRSLRLPLAADSLAAASEINGTITLDGSGSSLQLASGRFMADLSGSAFSSCRLGSAHVAVSAESGRLTASGSVSLEGSSAGVPPEGRLALSLDGAVRKTDLTFYTRTLEFSHINTSCFGPTAPASDLTGTARLEGSWPQEGSLSLTGALGLRSSQLATVGLDTVSVSARLREGAFAAEGHASAEGSLLRLSTEGSIATDGTSLSGFARVAGADIGLLLDSETLSSELSGDLTFSLETFGGRLLSGAADLRLDPSRLGDQQISELRLTGLLDSGSIEARLNIELPDGGGLRADVGGRLVESALDIPHGALEFTGLDAGTLLSQPELRTHLSGALEGAFLLSGEGLVTADAGLRLATSTINTVRLTGATAHLRVAGDSTRLDSEARFERGRLRVSGMRTVDDQDQHLELLASLLAVDAAGLSGLDSVESSLSGAFALAVDQRGSEPPEATALLSLGPSTLADLRIDTLLADASLHGKSLQVDTLLLETNAGSLTGRGPLSLRPGDSVRSDFRFTGTIATLSPIRRLTSATLLDGRGTVAGRIAGTYDRQRFELIPDLEFVMFDDFRLSGLEGRIAGERPFSTMWEADLQTGFISNPYVPVQRTDLEIEGGPDVATARMRVVIDRNRSVLLRGRIEGASPDGFFQLDQADVRLGQDRWVLLQPATVTLGSPYRVRNFLLYSGQQQVAIDGIVDLAGTQNLVITTEGLRTGSIADLLGYAGLDGELNTFLVLTGSAESPEVEGGFQLKDITSTGRRVGSLDARVAYRLGRLGIETTLTAESGRQLTTSGFIPYHLSLTGASSVASDLPADLTLRAADFPIGWVQPFLDPELVSRVDGNLTMDVHVRGTQGNPDLSGTVSVSDGSLLLPAAGIPYGGIQMEADLAGRRLLFRRAHLASGRGTLSASGSVEFVTLTRQRYDLRLAAEAFRAVHTQTYRATVSGNLGMTGTSEAPVLAGTLTLGPMDVVLTDELTAEALEPVRLSPRDLQILESRFGYRVSEADTTAFDFYTALAMDLQVEMDRDVWLRSPQNPQMDIEFQGRMAVQKGPNEDPRMFGTIDVNPRRSVVRQYGRRFAVESGRLRFNGPAEETVVDFRAVYQVPARRGERGPSINLDIDGRFGELKVVPSSSPQMETIDIVSYLATGRPAAEGLFGGGSALEQQAAGIALGQLSTLIEGVAGEELGLDVIEIENDGLKGVTFTVGKYVYLGDRQLFASLRQPVSLARGDDATRLTRNTEAAIEFELFRSLLVRLASRSRSPRFNLLYEYAY